MICHCGQLLKVLEVRERDAGAVKRRVYGCSSGHLVRTYEIPEPAWRAAQYDIRKALRGQAYHKHIAERAALAGRMRGERLAGATCVQLAGKHGLSVDMVRYYTRLPREALYPAAKRRKVDGN